MNEQNPADLKAAAQMSHHILLKQVTSPGLMSVTWRIICILRETRSHSKGREYISIKSLGTVIFTIPQSFTHTLFLKKALRDTFL